MIVDAVLFDNEFDCLKIRIRELEGLIDRLVIVQGNLTHQGEPREVVPENVFRGMLPDGVDLRSVVADLSVLAPESNLEPSNTRAIMQRNELLRGLDDLTGGDLVMISDVDEIPRHKSFEEASVWLMSKASMVAFEMDQFYFRLNLRDTCERFFGPRMLRREVLTYPHNFRTHFERAGEVVMRRSGWHFGWLGNTEHQMRKIRNFSHPELNTPEVCNAEFLETCLRTRMTAHNGHILERLDLEDGGFPLLVQEHPERFTELLA